MPAQPWWDTNGAFALYGAVAGAILTATPLLLLERSHRRMELKLSREARAHAGRSSAYQDLLHCLDRVTAYVNANKLELPMGARPAAPTVEEMSRVSAQTRAFGTPAMQKLVDSYVDAVITYVEIDTTLQTLDRTSYRDVFWRGAWDHWSARAEPTRDEVRALTEQIESRVQTELHGSAG